MRIPFVSDALYRRKLRRELIKTAHHDYYRVLEENEALRSGSAQLQRSLEEALKASREHQVLYREVRQAVSALVNTWATTCPEEDIAERLTCSEVDALAAFLAAIGKRNMALAWLEAHADGDEPEHDAHGGVEGKPADLDAYLMTLAA
ncbi:hypothetical protein ABZ419_09850 [Streptomyces cinnamoneus]|uniref:hypothetical protein n=1 Tax=Streptomyces cinnamoneus TaxID=53446 RepID=UPI0033DA0FE9